MKIDGMEFTKEQCTEIQRLAALGHRAKDIAMYLGLDTAMRSWFVMQAAIADSGVSNLIKEGILVSRATPEIKLHEAAENGNLDAIKQLNDIRKWRNYVNCIEDIDDNE